MVESTAKILRIRPLCANVTKLNETEISKKFFCQLAICDHIQKSSKCENGNMLFWNDEIEFQYKSGEQLKVFLWEEDKEEIMIGQGEFQLLSLAEGQTEQWIALIRGEERIGELKLALSLIIPKIEEIKQEVLPEFVKEQESNVNTHEIVNPPTTDVEQFHLEPKSTESEHDWEVLQSKSPQTKPPEVLASDSTIEEKFIPPEESRQIIRTPTEPQNPYFQTPLSGLPPVPQSSGQYYQDPALNQPPMIPEQSYSQQASSQLSNLQEIPNPLMNSQFSEGHPIPQTSTEIPSSQPHSQPNEGQTSQPSSENQVFQSGPQTPSQSTVQPTPAQAYPTSAQMIGQPYAQIPGQQYYQPQMPGQYGQQYQPMQQCMNQPYQPIPNQSNLPYQPNPQQVNSPYQQVPQNPSQPYPNPSQPYPSQAYPSPTQPYPNPSQTYPNPPQPYQSPAQPYPNQTQPYQNPSQPYPNPSQPYQNPSQPYPNPSQSYQNPQMAQQYAPNQPFPPACFPQNPQGQMPMQPNYPPQSQFPPNASAGQPSGFNQAYQGQPVYPPTQGYSQVPNYPPQGMYQQGYPNPQFQGSPQQVYPNPSYPSQSGFQMPYGYPPYPQNMQPGQSVPYPPTSGAQQPTSYAAYPSYNANPNQRS